MTETPNVVSGDASPAGSDKPDHLAGTDSRGRKLTYKPIDPLEEYRLAGLMGAKSDSARAFELATLAAGLRSIDGEALQFPNSEREVQARIQLLGAAGYAAIFKAGAEAYETQITGSDKADSRAVETIKN